MKFWTSLDLKDLHYRVEFKGPEDKSNPHVLLLVEPEVEDLAGLKDAFIVRFDQFTLALDTMKVNSVEKIVNTTWREARITPTEYWFVRNGELCHPCEGCDRVLHRAAGACDNGVNGCKKAHVTAKPIVPPAMDAYIPPSKCIDRRPFQNYSIDRLVTDDKRLEYNANERSCRSKKGSMTSLVKRTLCPLCMMHDNGNCIVNPSYCDSGPMFETDVPEPSNEMRKAIRFPDTILPYEKFKQIRNAAPRKEYDETKFIKDPLIVIGGQLNNDGRVALYRTSCTSSNVNACVSPYMTPDKMEQLTGISPNPIPGAASLLERFICAAVQKGDFLRSGKVAFGGYSEIYKLYYHDASDQFQCSMFFRLSEETRVIKTMGCAFARVSRCIVDALVPEKRMMCIRDELDKLRYKHGFKQARAACERIANTFKSYKERGCKPDSMKQVFEASGVSVD